MDNINNKYDVSFRISGNIKSINFINKTLKISPDYYYDTGSKIGMKNDKMVKRGDLRPGIWGISSSSTTDKIPTLIENMLIKLRPLKKELLELKSEGLKLDFFCGYFADDIVGGISIPSKLLMEIGLLGIDFELSFYYHIKRDSTE